MVHMVTYGMVKYHTEAGGKSTRRIRNAAVFDGGRLAGEMKEGRKWNEFLMAAADVIEVFEQVDLEKVDEPGGTS
jgi:hypothetical protein